MTIASATPDHTQCSRYTDDKARQLTLGLAIRSANTGKELLIDNFAGGGGASTGIEHAFGRPVDIAINHDGEALVMHTVNHPDTAHYQEDVFDIHPGFVTGQRPIGLAWFSPDCKHHSKAKGGKPREKKIRGLAWVALKWGAFQKPRAIAIENVEEIEDWGPLDDAGKPVKSEKGRTFRAFLDALSTGLAEDHPDIPEIYDALGADFPMERLYAGLGYKVEYRILRACDFGTPTIRKRLFIFARCDGLPIRWPTPTHGNPKLKGFEESKLLPWRTAAECIDWSIPAPSIFERSKPLVDATCRRIAKGIQRYVVDAAEPFIVSLTHQGGDRVESLSDPFKTITGALRGEKALIVPTLIQTGYGERVGQSPRVPGLDKPIGTLVGSQKHAVVSAFLAKHYTGVVGSDMADPVATVTSVDHHSFVTATMVAIDNQSSTSGQSPVTDPLKTIITENHHAVVMAHITKFNTGSTGYAADEPMHTITAGGEQARPGTAITQGIVTASMVHMGHGEQSSTGAKRWSHGIRDVRDPLNTVTASGAPGALVTANLVHYHADKRAGDVRASDLREPVKTQTTENRHALVTSNIVKLRGTNVGSGMDEPLHTISAQGTHHAEVRAFLIKYYEEEGDRTGLVTVHGEEYMIVDIGLRMLTPRELARAQGFPDTYILDPLVIKQRKIAPLSKSAQVRMIGNSVCPPLAKALIEANFTHEHKFALAA